MLKKQVSAVADFDTHHRVTVSVLSLDEVHGLVGNIVPDMHYQLVGHWFAQRAEMRSRSRVASR